MCMCVCMCAYMYVVCMSKCVLTNTVLSDLLTKNKFQVHRIYIGHRAKAGARAKGWD